MTGVRISTRTVLKEDIFNVYQSVNRNSSADALESLNSAKLNVTIYYNTRGMDCKRFNPMFNDIENLLAKNHLESPVWRRLVREKLFDYLFKLNKALKFNAVDEGALEEVMKDPVAMLRAVSDDLLDDYSESNFAGGQDYVEKNREILDLIKNDLLEMRELEPLFKKMDEKASAKFNAVLKATNRCLMILPQMKDVTINPNTLKFFRLYFEDLNNHLTDIFMPVREQQLPSQEAVERETLVGEEKKAEVQPVTGEMKNGERRAGGQETGSGYDGLDAVADLAELERKAKEGLLDADK